MPVDCPIPKHVTGLYVFAVINLICLFHASTVSCDIEVVSEFRNIILIENSQHWSGQIILEAISLTRTKYNKKNTSDNLDTSHFCKDYVYRGCVIIKEPSCLCRTVCVFSDCYFSFVFQRRTLTNDTINSFEDELASFGPDIPDKGIYVMISVTFVSPYHVHHKLIFLKK